MSDNTRPLFAFHCWILCMVFFWHFQYFCYFFLLFVSVPLLPLNSSRSTNFDWLRLEWFIWFNLIWILSWKWDAIKCKAKAIHCVFSTMFCVLYTDIFVILRIQFSLINKSWFYCSTFKSRFNLAVFPF